MTDTTLEALADTGDVAAALEAAVPHAQELVPPGVAAAVVVAAHRNDRTITSVDLERYQDGPVRHRGALKALTADGFIELFGQRATTESTVYADVDSTELVAVLNDDTDLTAGWRDFRLTFKPQLTPAWQHWVGHQGLHDQAKFAKVIEDGETEIVNPSPTAMLDLAQQFQASTTAKFKRAGRLRDGRTQLTYEEEIEATAGEGLVEIPESFTIEVAPFYGAQPVAVQCRLRYRIDRGDLTIGYSIHRHDEIVRQSFIDDVLRTVEDALPDHLVVAATPAGPVTPGR